MSKVDRGSIRLGDIEDDELRLSIVEATCRAFREAPTAELENELFEIASTSDDESILASVLDAARWSAREKELLSLIVPKMDGLYRMTIHMRLHDLNASDLGRALVAEKVVSAIEPALEAALNELDQRGAPSFALLKALFGARMVVRDATTGDKPGTVRIALGGSRVVSIDAPEGPFRRVAAQFGIPITNIAR